MKTLSWIRDWIAARRRRDLIASIRMTFAEFGCDVSGLSDDEVLERYLEFNKQMAEASRIITVNAEQAAKALSRFSKAMSRLDAT